MKHKKTLTIVPDHEGEKFTKSKCGCDVCISMHLANIEWEMLEPKTALQRRMKNIVSKIERDIRRRGNKLNKEIK